LKIKKQMWGKDQKVRKVLNKLRKRKKKRRLNKKIRRRRRKRRKRKGRRRGRRRRKGRKRGRRRRRKKGRRRGKRKRRRKGRRRRKWRKRKRNRKRKIRLRRRKMRRKMRKFRRGRKSKNLKLEQILRRLNQADYRSAAIRGTSMGLANRLIRRLTRAHRVARTWSSLRRRWPLVRTVKVRQTILSQSYFEQLLCCNLSSSAG